MLANDFEQRLARKLAMEKEAGGGDGGGGVKVLGLSVVKLYVASAVSSRQPHKWREMDVHGALVYCQSSSPSPPRDYLRVYSILNLELRFQCELTPNLRYVCRANAFHTLEEAEGGVKVGLLHANEGRLGSVNLALASKVFASTMTAAAAARQRGDGTQTARRGAGGQALPTHSALVFPKSLVREEAVGKGEFCAARFAEMVECAKREQAAQASREMQVRANFIAQSQPQITVLQGQRVRVLESFPDGWTRVEADKRSGFVPTSFLESVRAVPAAPAATAAAPAPTAEPAAAPAAAALPRPLSHRPAPPPPTPTRQAVVVCDKPQQGAAVSKVSSSPVVPRQRQAPPAVPPRVRPAPKPAPPAPPPIANKPATLPLASTALQPTTTSVPPRAESRPASLLEQIAAGTQLKPPPSTTTTTTTIKPPSKRTSLLEEIASKPKLRPVAERETPALPEARAAAAAGTLEGVLLKAMGSIRGAMLGADEEREEENDASNNAEWWE